jgi:hypothetical protein
MKASACRSLRAENKIGGAISANKIGILGRKTRQFSSIFNTPALGYLFYINTRMTNYILHHQSDWQEELTRLQSVPILA